MIDRNQQTSIAQPRKVDQQRQRNQQIESSKVPTIHDESTLAERNTTDLPQILRRDVTLRTSIEERHLAILMALKILTSVSEGLRTPDKPHGGARAWRVI